MDRRQFVVGAAGLALAPRAFAGSLSRRPVALVTADLESRLVVVGLATGRGLRFVTTRPRPSLIATAGEIAAVAPAAAGRRGPDRAPVGTARPAPRSRAGAPRARPEPTRRST